MLIYKYDAQSDTHNATIIYSIKSLIIENEIKHDSTKHTEIIYKTKRDIIAN